MADQFRLTLETTEAPASLIALLRRHDLGAIAPLRQSIAARLPILDRDVHHNQYAEFLKAFVRLLDDLDAAGSKYLIEIDGEVESREYVDNLVERWPAIREETLAMTDLESGDPSIESLQWLKRSLSAADFRDQLERILAGDGFECDAETLTWARRELEDSSLDDQVE